MLWEQYDEISTNMSIKVTKPRIVMLKLKDWLMIESTCTNEKQTSDEQNRSGCVDVWIWVVGRSGSIPPPVAPDRQLVSVRLPPPPSLVHHVACPLFLSTIRTPTSAGAPHCLVRSLLSPVWLLDKTAMNWNIQNYLIDIVSHSQWSIVHRWCNKGWV